MDDFWIVRVLGFFIAVCHLLARRTTKHTRLLYYCDFFLDLTKAMLIIIPSCQQLNTSIVSPYGSA